MNKHQKEVAKRAKLIKRKTNLPWYECKWVAKCRFAYDLFIKCW
ncbi:amino acid transporter [Clostridium niameyense]|uniref:Amino acid transporter n=1 Tax=Clostridium niameyense TaxID=1622073 RepID=A0A6M0REC7_9CLOT|nr:amino acid transporter [Clostridium niameyense]NEZ47798.1 amino acid transporter [Clostridium niameyense]